jgi:hypothetical protein
MRILLGVSGSISAYKAIDIARELFKKGHEVKVILTEGALKFVIPEVFTYLGVQDVYKSQDDFLTKMSYILTWPDGVMFLLSLPLRPIQFLAWHKLAPQIYFHPFFLLLIQVKMC